jgi:hypothetical protein
MGIFKMKKYSNEINKILERIIKGSKYRIIFNIFIILKQINENKKIIILEL